MRKLILTALKWICKQAWALVSDAQWDFDPFKAGGFAAFGLSAALIGKTVAMVDAGVDALLIGIVAGLVTVPISMGTYLFGLARKSDATILGAGGEK